MAGLLRHHARLGRDGSLHDPDKCVMIAASSLTASGTPSFHWRGSWRDVGWLDGLRMGETGSPAAHSAAYGIVAACCQINPQSHALKSVNGTLWQQS